MGVESDMTGVSVHKGSGVSGADDSATPWGPLPKKQWLQCAGNIDTTCPPFLPSPARYHSLPTASCSFAPALTGREQGMLIKGCENWGGGAFS